MEKNKVQQFGVQLTQLLSKHCDELTMQKIESKLSVIRNSEKALVTQAKRIPDGDTAQSLVEESYIYPSIAECQIALPKKEFISVVTQIANLCMEYGEFVTAEALLNNAIESARESKQFMGLAAEALQYRAGVLVRQARWEPAEIDIKESRRLFSLTKNDIGIGKNENTLGIYTAQQGKTKESIVHFRKAAALFEKSKQGELSSTAHMNLGIVATMRGNFDEALVAYKRALPEFENAGDVSRLAELHHNLGMLFLSRAELDSAQEQFDESLNYSGQIHYEDLIGLASLGKATAFVRKRDFPMAQVYGNRALNIFRKLNAHLSVADTYKVKGIIQRELKHYDAAELYFNTSISLNLRYRSQVNLGEAYYEVGLLYKECNDAKKAKQVFQKSLKCFQSVGAKHNIEQVKTQLHSLKN